MSDPIFAVLDAALDDIRVEHAYLAAGQEWQMSEGAYALIQSTKPTTAAVGLTDSPAGLAASEALRTGPQHGLEPAFAGH
jgi:hypothetical protein